jgi:hypothetical protein
MEVVPLKRARVWGNFFGLVLVIEQLVIVTEILGYYPQPYNPERLRSIANDYFLLMIIEWVNIVGTIASNINFLLLRSCCRHKVQFDKLPQKKQSPNVDTTIAIKQVLNIFISFAVPSYVCLTMSCLDYYFHWFWTDMGAYVSHFGISFAIFCHWRKGPSWWLKIAPIFMFVLIFSIYVFIPVVIAI